MELRWERMTAPELKARCAEGALPILPVGSLEQHGPHLPVWTDSFLAHALALAAAGHPEAPPAVVLPPMWLGLSEHHLPFNGTITLDFPAFHGVIRGVARSLRAQGWGRLLILNGHGGNIEPLAVSVRELAHELAMPIVATSWPSVAPAEIAAALTTQPGIQHACEGETSLWLALDAGQVREGRIAEAAGGNAGVQVAAGYSRFHSFAERAPRTGVRGDPRAATAAKGEAMIAAIAARLARAMHDPALWTTPDPVWGR
ncbi:creatininase family protein [Rubritepida flocculans]|uniref:creatininase family protein n=1 Tax=Rubritepida flocculans TaxID=182403 RepID=UPI000404622F|nr:creatininase family protein [Rubritepida flocculans]